MTRILVRKQSHKAIPLASDFAALEGRGCRWNIFDSATGLDALMLAVQREIDRLGIHSVTRGEGHGRQRSELNFWGAGGILVLRGQV